MMKTKRDKMERDRRWGSLYDIYYGLSIGMGILIIFWLSIIAYFEGFNKSFMKIFNLSLVIIAILFIFWIVFYSHYKYWRRAEGYFRDFADKNNFVYEKQEINKKFNGFFGELSGVVDGVSFRVSHYAGWFYYAYTGICFEATADKKVGGTILVKYLPLRLRIFGDLEKTRFPNSFTLLRKPVSIPRTQVKIMDNRYKNKVIVMTSNKEQLPEIFTDSVLENIVKTKAEVLVYQDKVYCSKFWHLKSQDDLRDLTDLTIEVAKNINKT